MRAQFAAAAVICWLTLFTPHAAAQGLPGAPVAPSAIVTGTSVTISWSAPASGTPLYYVILAGTTAGSTNLGSHNVGAGTSVTAQLANGTYFIRVAAVNAVGQGPASAEVSFTIGVPPPGPPGMPTATVSGSSVAIAWSAPVSGGAPAYYVLTIGTRTGGAELGSHNVGVVTSVVAPLPPGVYFIRVVAVNAGGESAASPERRLMFGVEAPGKPGTPLATVSGSVVTIGWLEPTTGGRATHYKIVAGTASGATDLGTHTLGPNPYVTATLGNGHYFVRVIAVNQWGESAPSDEEAFTVGPGAAVPGPPIWYDISVDGYQVRLAWIAPVTGGSPTDYVLRIGTSPGGSEVGSFALTSREYTTTLPTGTYYARVSGRNSAGVGAVSAEKTLSVTLTGSVDILSNSIGISSSGRYVIVLGEVQNNTNQDVHSIFVDAKYRDESGTLLLTKTGLVYGFSRKLSATTGVLAHWLRPGQRGCFAIYGSDLPATTLVISESVARFSAATSLAPSGDVRIGDTLTTRFSDGYLEFEVTVRNHGTLQTTRTGAVFSVKGSNGRQLECSSAYVSGPLGDEILAPATEAKVKQRTLIPATTSVHLEVWATWVEPPSTIDPIRPPQ